MIAELYRRKQWDAWQHTHVPEIEDIPPSKAQLLARMSGSDSFDGGRTSRWLTQLTHATWRAVRDKRTGHTVHVVSDRAYEELTGDVVLALRLLEWMSARRPITFYWWDQPWVRELPAETTPGRLHINGGWAVPGRLDVHVYRREEVHKVMLHETVHALKLDVDERAATASHAQFEQSLNRKLWPHFGEAYTELLAEWLWAIARGKSLGHARRLWVAQCACSASQAAIVWARIKDVSSEDTNVFGYYVLKWVLMAHLDDVLLRPTASVPLWFGWWQATKLAAAPTSTTVRLGMTCGAS